MASKSFANRRDGGIRVTVCKPVLIIDGRNYEVTNFSRTGFEAVLPDQFNHIGATGNGELHFETTGAYNIQDVAFKVVRQTPKGRVGATYEPSNSRSTLKDI
ncbi:hypothetical protein [Curvivirga sp.]|uniref:hypothetical protein n=1 Tax=Curvivirga sp. TaxID=2856848 RepID=UPI003B5A5453